MKPPSDYLFRKTLIQRDELRKQIEQYREKLWKAGIAGGTLLEYHKEAKQLLVTCLKTLDFHRRIYGSEKSEYILREDGDMPWAEIRKFLELPPYEPEGDY